MSEGKWYLKFEYYEVISKFCKSFYFFQIHNVFAQSCQVQLLGLRVGKRVAQVQFMVMELQQKNIALAIIMNFHGGQDVVDGNGIRIWVKIVAFQVIIYKESLPKFLFCTIYIQPVINIMNMIPN